MSSRIYSGLWRVLVVYDTEDGEEYAATEATEYEECERMAILFGMSVPFEGHRVKRALIVGPVVP